MLTQETVFQSGGRALGAYFCRPDGAGPVPGILVIHEAYGLNDNIKRACPVVGSYPRDDFTASAGQALEAELDKHGVAHDIKIYPHAKHSFFNDQSPRTYNAEVAQDSWQRVLAFFEEHVK